MRPAITALRACLLHRYDWSESSLILDLFTRERGRLAVAARGAKRPYSQFRSVLLPFHPLAITLGRQPLDEGAEIFALRQAEWLGSGVVLGGAALFAGFYLNELLMRMLARQDPHPRLYDAYEATLPQLMGEETQLQAALRAFELVLLRETGLLPDLSRVTLTQLPLQPQGRYALRAEQGVVPRALGVSDSAAAASPGLEGAQLLALASALRDDDASALQQACRQGPAGAAAGLRAGLRELLHYHLGSQSLRSRQVLHGLRRLLDVPASTQRT